MREAVNAAQPKWKPQDDLHASGRLSPPRRRRAWHARARTGARKRGQAGGARNEVELRVNGDQPLRGCRAAQDAARCLRENFLLNGTHAGCEHGVCGACTVLVDGEPVRSCLMFAVQADGYEITTIEGLAPGPGELSVMQDAFCETHGLQCGYCTPGMILAGAGAAARATLTPTREDIVEAISGNICRCTGYGQIVEAIALAAERLRAANVKPGEG